MPQVRKGVAMLLYRQCGARIARLRKQIGRLKRRLARLYVRPRRPKREVPEDTLRQVRLREYMLRKSAEAGFETFARLAEAESRLRRRREEEAA